MPAPGGCVWRDAQGKHPSVSRMSHIGVSILSGLANLAWKAFQSVNARIPEGDLPHPKWAERPLLIVVGAALGYGLAVPLSRMHRDVRLAERIRMEETGKVEGTIDASDAFRNTGRPTSELYAEAIELRKQYALLGGLLGGWAGLVIAVKLVSLSIRRRRDEYSPDPAFCVSCGRCFEYCPSEHPQRQELTKEIPVLERSGVCQ